MHVVEADHQCGRGTQADHAAGARTFSVTTLLSRPCNTSAARMNADVSG